MFSQVVGYKYLQFQQ